MKVTVLRAFGCYSVGDVIPEMPSGQAVALMERGMVEEVRAIVAPVNRMMTAAVDLVRPRGAQPHPKRHKRR